MKKKILIVDDTPDIAIIYATALKVAHFSVELASNGKEGLEKALIEKPDLILLDVSMPVMDGFEMLRKLRKEGEFGKNIPVILLTNLSAGGKEDFIKNIAETTPMYYVVKTDLTPAQVVKKLKKCLGLALDLDL